MKINPDYRLRELAGENIIVNQGRQGADMTRIIALNRSARLLYEQLSDRDFTLEEAAKVLVEVYGIAPEQAARDAAVWVDALKKCKIIE